MGMKPLDSDLSHCDTLNIDKKVQLSAIETRQVSIVNTHKVYNNENHNVMSWVTYVRSKSFLSFSTPILQCIINNSYVSAQ